MTKKHANDLTKKPPKLDDDEFRLMRAALVYAAKGIPVFPLTPGSKVPLANSKGLLDATTDADVIRDWWSDDPRRNIGIPTGKASGLWVLDVDMGDGKIGKKSLKKLIEKHGELPTTRTIQTPSGGLHFIFAYPDKAGEWRSSATSRDAKGKVHGPLLEHLDVRAEGGYIAAHPSTLAAGGTYTPLNPDMTPARMPKWLRELTRYEAPRQEVVVRLDAKSIPDELRPRLEQWTSSAIDGEVQRLAKMKHGAVEAGAKYVGEPWDNTSYQVACRLIEIAVAEWSPVELDDVRNLFVANVPKDHDFDKREHQRIWQSALAKTKDKRLPLPVEVEALFLLPLAKKGGKRDAKMPALDADAFFAKADGLLAAKTAAAINYDIAIGADNQFWSYETAGVWRRHSEVISERLVALLGDKYRTSYVTTIAEVVKASRPPKLSGDPHGAYINVRNGMFSWKTGKLLDHSPDYLSTVQLPIEYDAKAKSPAFNEWLARTLPADTIPLVWEVIGYMLYNGNPLQKAILFHGDGGNGKGTVLRIIQALAGRANCSAINLRDITEGKFEVAGLFGKLANIAGDIEARYLRDSAKFKAITGQNPINAQFKYQPAFEFECWAVPIFAANELWRSADTSEGYFRRWVVVPFPNRVTDRDDGFDEADLMAELPGIFNGAMTALRSLMKRGKFELGINAEIMRDDFVMQSDTVQIWLSEDEDVKAHDPKVVDEWANRRPLYNAFKSWCQENGHPAVSSTKFYRRLRHLGYTESRHAGGFGFYGIALNQLHIGVANFGLGGLSESELGDEN
jgi:putative DNA primase/helicase